MNRQLVIRLALCIFPLGLTAEPARQSTTLNVQAENDRADKATSQSLFWYKAGLLNGSAEKEPLEKVLAELNKAASVEPVLKFKPADDEVVSFIVKDQVLADGLKEILRNYNYIFLPPADAGKGSKLILLGRTFAGMQEPLTPTEEGVAAIKPENNPTEPWSLDEFRKLDRASLGSTIDLTQEEREALEREQLEQRMDRALDVLETDFDGLKEVAINELTGIDSPEATSGLLNTALNVESQELQQIAAEALWHHAADLGFKNPEANQALQTLAEKGNPTTKEFARKALEDAKRYAKRVSEEEGG